MNRRFNNPSKRNTYILISLSLIFLLAISLIFLDLGKKPKSKVANPKFEADERLHLFKIEKPTTPITSEKILERIKKTREIKLDFLVNTNYLDRVTMRCELLSQHEQVS